MRRLLPIALALFVLSLVIGQAGSTQPKSAEAASPAGWGDDVELLLVEDAQLVRVHIRVEIDGKPARAAWDRSIRALFDFLDRDGDGNLSPAEAARMPTPFDLRRILWGNFYPPTGIGEGWKIADTNGDGKLSRDEVIAFYLRSGVGVQVGAVRIPGTEALNAALVKQLDRDGDGKISVTELKAAEKSLAALDLNEDELISAGELIRGMSYPGSIGAIRLDAPSTATKLPMPRDPAMWLFPADHKDSSWAIALHTALGKDGKFLQAKSRMDAKEFAALDTDGDGSLSVAELARWRARPAIGAWVASFSEESPKLRNANAKAGAAGSIEELHREGIRLSVRTDSGKAGEMWTKSRQGFINQFVAADADRAGFLDDKSSFALKDRGLKLLLTFADRDGDGKLTRAEFDAWLKLMDELTRGQVLVTVLDHGKGLYECIDADMDGVLSVRELRTASARLEKAGCLRDGFLDLNRLPRTVRFTVSQGHPKSALPIPKRAGPDWFLAMDRNGDGDVSRKEWVGDPALFDRYDLDRDGLLSADEAEKVVLKQK